MVAVAVAADHYYYLGIGGHRTPLQLTVGGKYKYIWKPAARLAKIVPLPSNSGGHQFKVANIWGCRPLPQILVALTVALPISRKFAFSIRLLLLFLLPTRLQRFYCTGTCKLLETWKSLSNKWDIVGGKTTPQRIKPIFHLHLHLHLLHLQLQLMKSVNFPTFFFSASKSLSIIKKLEFG